MEASRMVLMKLFQASNRDADIENRPMDLGEGE